MYSAAEFDSAALHYLLVLAHTLWQAPLWAALLWVGLRLLSTRYLEWRYGLALMALAGVVGSPLLTASLMRMPPPRTTGHAAENAAVSNAAQPAAATETIPRAAATDGNETSSGAATMTAAAARPTVPTSDVSEEPVPEDEGGAGWPTAVAFFWLCGAAWMLARRARCLLAARALADGEPIEDPAIVRLLEQVQRALRIRTFVRLVASEKLTTPVVIGALRPTLVLPVSLMTGLSPTELQAIFAHELAHIRRHDFLVNLVQLLVEAVLFFNPAVWWISRQVRREREACCDAMAVAVTRSSPLRYAEMLAGWAERAQWKEWHSAGSPAAMAMVGAEPSGLLDRIERLLTPGYRPTQRVSRRACMIALLMAVAGVAILQRGSDVAVAFAAQLLSDQERVERVVKAREDVHGDALAPEGTFTLAGSVRTSDGKPWSDVSVMTLEVRDSASRSASRELDGETFEYEVQTGQTWLSVNAPGYAHTIRGPFSGQPGEIVDVPEIVLRPGFSGKIRVIDAHGQPVANAEITLFATASSSGLHSATVTTDASGTAKLENLADHTYSASVKASGFEPLSARELRFEPGGEVVLTPTRAEPTSGVVVDVDGNPAAGIEVWQHHLERPGMSDHSRRQLASTDAKGNFVLDQLRGDSTYTIFLRVGPRVTQVISGVKAGQSDLRWRMLPEVSVQGRVVGAEPANLPKSIGYSNTVASDSRDQVTSRGPRQQVGAEGRFTIEHLSPGKLTIEAADRSFHFDVPESRDDLVVDLSVPEETLAKRKVILTFKSPDGPAPLRGSTIFHIEATGDEPAIGSRIESRREEVPVKFEGPTVELEAFAPGTLYDGNREMIGFWFDDLRLEIPAGDEPFRATVDVLPAGAVTGRVLRADGTPIGDRGIDVSWRMQYRDDSGMQTEHPPSVRTNDRGEYFASPVILGAETVLKVSEGHNILFSEPFTLTADKPTAEIDLTLPATVRVEGVVLDEAGNPLPNVPITLAFKHEHGSTSFSPATNTGSDGRFTFAGLNAEVGEYTLEIKSRRDFLPVRVPLRTDGQPIEVRLQPGRVVTGTVVDRDGQPVEGVEVYANPADYQVSSGGPYMFEAEAPTDAKGRFRLSNLPDRRMRLRARPMYNLDDVVVSPAEAASAPDVTLQGQVPDWHRNPTSDQ